MTYQKENHPVSAYVGERLRKARKAQGLSQKDLGSRLSQPVTFQQVQKYERGTNRIALSKLWEFAEALHLPPEYFLPLSDQEERCYPSLQEVELLQHFRALPKDAQLALLTFLKVKE